MPNTNLDRLDKFLTRMDSETLTKEDFLNAFSKVADLVVNIQKDQGNAITKLEETYKMMIDRMQNDHSMTLADMKKQVDGLFVKDRIVKMESDHADMKKMHEDMMNMADMKVKSLKNGKDGMTGMRGLPGTLISAGQVRDKLEQLKNDDRLDKSAIRGLDEMESKIEKASKMERTRIFAGPNANAVQVEDLTAQCNGSNKSFITPSYRIPLMLLGKQGPFVYSPTADYTLGNGKVTLTAAVDAPVTGQTLLFLYIK